MASCSMRSATETLGPFESLSIERFSFECRIVIGFAFTTPPDWFKKFAPFFSSNQK